MPGTAPTDARWLFVEYAGSWGRQATAESRLPAPVKAFLADLPGVRVQLIRRHRGPQAAGTQVFTAVTGPGGARVGATRLADVAEVTSLDLGPVSSGTGPGLTAHDASLWLVCTNGRRDRCCAERGRPIAEALAARWPEETWETTHLGGHRFAGTLLALPSGLTLGRLDPTSALRACADLEQGRWPGGRVRGRAGVPAAAQVAEQHLRDALGLAALDDVAVLDEVAPLGRTDADGRVVLRAAGRRWQATLRIAPGRPRRQSCADPAAKEVPVLTVVGLEPAPG